MLWVRVLPGLCKYGASQHVTEGIKPSGKSALKREEDNMGKLVQFIRESYAELRKVIWPSRPDVISAVKIVIISTILIAAVLGLVDVLLLLGVQTVF